MLAIVTAYQECLVTCKLVTSQVVQWLLLQMPEKVGFSITRVNKLLVYQKLSDLQYHDTTDL